MYDVWLYYAGQGWWLDEEGKSRKEAGDRATRMLDVKAVVAAAILPAGNRLGLFTRRATDKDSVEYGEESSV